MQFRTDLKIKKSKWNIDYKSNIVSVGSCFSSNISTKLETLQFQILNNPFGTVYNPISIFRSLKYKANDFENTLIERDGKWVSYLSHSDISSFEKSDLLHLLSNKSVELSEELKKCEFLILTLGSAKVYTLESSNLLVANCHKIPQNQFQNRILTMDEIQAEFEELSTYLNTVNPNIKIILSVSPIRYLSDGFEMNSISKAALILACHKIIEKYKNVAYFPAYELILDDLRDYRYYNSDLLHPNSMAVQYVFEKFSDSYFEERTQTLIGKINKINKSLEHIPFNKASKTYQDLMNKIKSQITEIEGDLNVTELYKKLKLKQPI